MAKEKLSFFRVFLYLLLAASVLLVLLAVVLTLISQFPAFLEVFQ